MYLLLGILPVGDSDVRVVDDRLNPEVQGSGPRLDLPGAQSPVHCDELCPVCALHLLPFLRVCAHDWNAGVGLSFRVGYALKHRVHTQVCHHPVVQVSHVSDCVQCATLTQCVGILSQQPRRDDAAVVLGLFEMGIGEAEEHLGELSLEEEARQVLHGVGARHGQVVRDPFSLPLRHDAQTNVLGHPGTNLHAYLQHMRQNGAQANEQAAEATADIRQLDVLLPACIE